MGCLSSKSTELKEDNEVNNLLDNNYILSTYDISLKSNDENKGNNCLNIMSEINNEDKKFFEIYVNDKKYEFSLDINTDENKVYKIKIIVKKLLNDMNKMFYE